MFNPPGPVFVFSTLEYAKRRPSQLFGWMSTRNSLPVRLLFFFILLSACARGSSAQINVTTERYDQSRLGANLNELQLNTSNVNVNTFGKLWSYQVSGSVHAQPLYVQNVTFPGKGVHNALYVVTMNDVVYAFDADSSSNTPLLSLDLTTQVAGSTPVPITDLVSPNLNIVGNVGIESTPYIDLSTNTMYLVARTKESANTCGSVNGNYCQRLHALDITTFAEKFGGPIAIQGSVPGTGNASVGGTLTFDPKIHNQRSSLALANGQISIAWASHEDTWPYHGWVMSYNAANLQQTGIWCSSPDGFMAGVWMAGRGPAVDASGNLYYMVGNGDWNGTRNFGESMVKLGSTAGMPLLDWFTPDSWSSLNAGDVDYGSSGPILIPGTDLITGAGKTSIFYVMHTGNLGHESAGNGQIVQSLANNGGVVTGGPVYWNRSAGAGPWMYVWSNGCDFLKAYHFNGATFDTGIVSESTIASPCGQSGGVLTLSANGSTAGSGIIWSSMPLADNGDHGVHQGVLRAFNADDLTKELWNSHLNAARDDSGNWPKYSPPTVVNGRVYMASFPADGVSSAPLNVYGLLSALPPPSVSSVNPNSGTQGQSLPSVIITGNSFQSGATCNFGAGITVNSCAFNSATQLTANITITSTATVGSRNVTVTNPDNQTGTLPNGFTVTTSGPPPPPTVNSVNPNAGAQGQSLPSVIVTGNSFQSGATCNFGAGITVNSCAFNSATQLTANITITSTATVGSRNVTVTNPDNQTSTLTNGFSVTAPPAISLIQKATFSRQPTSGGTVTLTLPQATAAGHTLIVGMSFWPLDISTVTDGSGDSFTRGLATSIFHNVNGSATYSNFYYAKSTAGGTTSLTLNFSGGSTYLLVAVAEVAGLDPAAPLDQSGFHESLTATTAWSSAAVTTTSANGYLFSWAASEAPNTTCANPASGWVIESQTNPATVCLLDRVVSATGSYQASVSASTAGNYAMEIVTFKGGSSAPPPPPSATSVNPNSGAQGQSLPSVIVTGNSFQSGATCNFGAGITVNSCAFNSATQLTANITITSTATVGSRNVTVTNPDNQTGTLPNGLTVTAALLPPSVSSVNPNSGTQGQSLPSVIITGSAFQSGATCNFGAGITVNSCAFNSATQLTANITITSTATVGSRNVTVTNPDNQTSTLPNGFTVTTSGPPPPPTVNSVNPNVGAQGQNLPSVIISGSAFQNGATCSFGAGIMVNSCAFNSATQLTASITITSTATVGTRNVSVTNPDNQTSTLTNGFSVTAPPAISLIQKATFSRQPTSGGTVTLTLPQATAAGHTLIVGMSFWPLDISTVTDGSGDSFTRGLATSIFHNVNGSATYSNFFYAKSTAGGTTSLTLNFSGGSTYLLVAVAEVAGLDPSVPLDQSGYHESLTATAAWSSAAVTTTAANEYLFSWAATEASRVTCSSPASGWVIESQTNPATVCLLDRIVSATGSYQASVTPSSAQNYAMEIVTFKGGL